MNAYYIEWKYAGVSEWSKNKDWINQSTENELNAWDNLWMNIVHIKWSKLTSKVNNWFKSLLHNIIIRKQ